MKKILSLALSLMLLLSLAGFAQAEEELKYGTASLSFAEYWAGELGVDAATLNVSSDALDKEGNKDAGGLDAVSRATTKHGIFRQQFGYEVNVTGELVLSKKEVEKDGRKTTEFETDPSQSVTLRAAATYTGLKEEEMMTEPNDKGLYTEDLAKTFEHEGKEYKIVSYTVDRMKEIPVAVPASKAAEAAEKYGFVENAEINADTNGLKVLGDNGFGPRQEKEVTGEKTLVLDRVKTVYDTKYGSDAEAYVYFKKADGSELSQEEFINYALQYRTARVDYYGEDSTYSKLVKSYGTKHSADSWWSDHHGTRIDVGVNYSFERFQGAGPGYYTITLIANGYSDVVAKVQFLPQYTGEVEMKLVGDILSVNVADESILANAKYSVSSGRGKDAVRLAADEALAGKETRLASAPEKGTEYDVVVTLENYAPLKAKVTAE